MIRKMCNKDDCNNPRWARGYCQIHDREEHPEKYQIKQKTPIEQGVNAIKMRGVQSKPKPIRQVSEKRAIKDEAFAIARIAFLKVHPICQANLNDCAIEATDVHHLFSGRNKDKYYLDMSTWKAVCRNCHRAIHNYLSAEEAIKLGLKRVE